MRVTGQVCLFVSGGLEASKGWGQVAVGRKARGEKFYSR